MPPDAAAAVACACCSFFICSPICRCGWKGCRLGFIARMLGARTGRTNPGDVAVTAGVTGVVTGSCDDGVKEAGDMFTPAGLCDSNPGPLVCDNLSGAISGGVTMYKLLLLLTALPGDVDEILFSDGSGSRGDTGKIMLLLLNSSAATPTTGWPYGDPFLLRSCYNNVSNPH